MARARLIKPSFFTNDDLAELSMAARLLFAGLWTIADREGRLEDRPKRIKAEVMPFDSVNVDRLLDDLAGRGFIARYESESLRLIQIVSFSRHQSPHPKEPPSRFPVMGEPMSSNGRDSDKPSAKTEPIQSARGTLADPVLPIPMAGPSAATASPPPSYGNSEAPEDLPADIREVRDLVMAKLPQSAQRDELAWDEALSFARDYRGQHEALARATDAVRRLVPRQLPYPSNLRPHMPPIAGAVVTPTGPKPYELPEPWRDHVELSPEEQERNAEDVRRSLAERKARQAVTRE